MTTPADLNEAQRAAGANFYRLARLLMAPNPSKREVTDLLCTGFEQNADVTRLVTESSNPEHLPILVLIAALNFAREHDPHFKAIPNNYLGGVP